MDILQFKKKNEVGMLIRAILLLLEVSWRKGKMSYIFSSRLDRKKRQRK